MQKTCPLFINATVPASSCHTAWMPCLEYFTLIHWSSAAQTHDLELPPEFSEILEWCAGTVFPHLSNATLHGFSPQDTRRHVIEAGGHTCVNLSPSPFPSGWHITFWLPVSRRMHLEKLLIVICVLRSGTPWKVLPHHHESNVTKIFLILSLYIDNKSLFYFTTCCKMAHTNGHQKKKKKIKTHATTKKGMILWYLGSFSTKQVFKISI